MVFFRFVRAALHDRNTLLEVRRMHCTNVRHPFMALLFWYNANKRVSIPGSYSKTVKSSNLIDVLRRRCVDGKPKSTNSNFLSKLADCLRIVKISRLTDGRSQLAEDIAGRLGFKTYDIEMALPVSRRPSTRVRLIGRIFGNILAYGGCECAGEVCYVMPSDINYIKEWVYFFTDPIEVLIKGSGFIDLIIAYPIRYAKFLLKLVDPYNRDRAASIKKTFDDKSFTETYPNYKYRLPLVLGYFKPQATDRTD